MDEAFICSNPPALTRFVSYLTVFLWALPFGTRAQFKQSIPAEHLSPRGNIAIGLLLPDQSHLKVSNAAELAIQEANAAGGYKQHDFELIIRTAEGFWGAGSKESVSLVFEDHVRAIIGSLDGRNGHLAEQVATKSHLTYIETYATEPTLSQAFVPWFMRVVPNDDQQSEVITGQILKEGGENIGILSIETYDTRYAVRSLSKAVARKSEIAPLLISLDPSNIQLQEIVDRIDSHRIDHLILPFDAPYLTELIKQLRSQNPDLKIYGTLHLCMGIESRNVSWEAYEGVYLTAYPYNREVYQSLSNCHSAYLYDAVRLVINAIHQVGTERETLTDYISRSTYSKGSTGTISFDELGNRQSIPSLLRIENGALQLIHHP